MDENTIKKITEEKESVNIKDAASILDISPATIRNWLKAGYLTPYLDKNKKYVFYKEDIDNIKSKIIEGNFDKLNSRANKSKAKKTFLPEEYINNKNDFEKLDSIIDFIKNNNIDLQTALFLLCINLLKKEKIISKISLNDIISKKDFLCDNAQIKIEMVNWLSEINTENIKMDFSYLLSCELSEQEDILGAIYQSILIEGDKSQNGSYYSPSNIVSKMIEENVKNNQKVLDICCGTGKFLLSFANIIKNPLNIYGMDFDPIAIKIARINILLKYKKIDFVPNIICTDSLIRKEKNSKIDDLKEKDKFDVIATNPPWGAHFSAKDVKRLKEQYPEIKSGESFSYFIIKSHDMLKDGGTLSFILPESILNVKSHSDIRKYILDNFQIKRINSLGKIFKNVFTSVIRLDLEKNNNHDGYVNIVNKTEEYKIKQSTWSQNKDYIFNVEASEFDNQIIEKIYRQKHITLENKADWALGIVTGKNKKYIIKHKAKDYEPIYTGGDINKFVFKKPSKHIKLEVDKYQQVAPLEKYRAKEKLVYKFISKYLVFAYDNQKRLTLNSANVVIPKIPDYPIKVIAALLNSSLYQFIFQKKFGSIKVLRSQLEQMPLLQWDKATYSKIIKLVDATIKNADEYEKLDNYILDKCSLSQEEKKYVIKYRRK